MRNILAIGRREVLSFFVSPVAYFVITGFLLLAGYFFFNYLLVFNVYMARFQGMPYPGAQPTPNLNQFVAEAFYQTLLIVLVFLIPLLTMRVIAEEKRRGTFELLVTSPISVIEIVVGKFLGLAFVITTMMVLAGCFPLMLCLYGNPEIMPLLSGLLGILLCALGFASIGMAVSAFTENQIVAGISSMVVLLLLYVIQSPAEAMGNTVGAAILTYLSPIAQVRDMVRGVISISSLVYFGSLIALGLFLSTRALEAYRWR